MTGGRRRTIAARIAGSLGIALVAVAAPALAAPTPAAPTPADPTPTPTATAPALPVAVTLDALRPLAPQPDDTLRLAGSVRNQSPTAVTGMTVQLGVSRAKVGSRGQFDDYAGTPDGPAPADALYPSSAAADLTRSELAPGQTARFHLSVPMSSLGLPEIWQVYELAVVVNGLVPTGQQQVGRLRTFLPYAPVGVPGVGQPTQLAWLWPLVDRPHRTGDTTWTDDGLAPELRADGRLGALVAAGTAA